MKKIFEIECEQEIRATDIMRAFDEYFKIYTKVREMPSDGLGELISSFVDMELEKRKPESKLPEKFKTLSNYDYQYGKLLVPTTDQIVDKINEIIDYIEKKER